MLQFDNLQSYPFSSQRMPLVAQNGVVATSQPLAAQAGLRMLQQGGNAVDAAVATAIALTVLEPTSNGIGGDAFALVWDGKRLHGLNGSGRSPATLSAARDLGECAFGWWSADNFFSGRCRLFFPGWKNPAYSAQREKTGS